MNRMSKLLAAALAAAIWFPIAAKAQAPPANFTFGPGAPCSAITSWNGVADAYPQDMGAICLNQGDLYGGYGSYIDVPWQLGFLNNGYLAGCDQIAWQPKVFTIGDGTHAGDAFTVAGSTTCPYYTGEYGGVSDNLLDGFSVVASYTVVQRKTCGRYGCHTYLSNVLTGGTGTVTETLLTANGCAPPPPTPYLFKV